MGRAAIIGFLAGVAALTFNVAVSWGQDRIWRDDIEYYRFLGGSWWWVVVLTGTGLLVGLLRRWWKIPDDLDGSLTILQGASVDRSTALPAIGISVVSLVGGASLGPFDGGVRSGAMIGDWWASVRGIDEREREQTTLSGINGALGGLLTAPILATLLITELRWTERRQYYRVLIPSLTAAIFGFTINFAVLGDTFLGVYRLPPYEIEPWHLAVALGLGFAAAILAWILGLVVFSIRRWVVPIVGSGVLRGTLGGLAMGVIAVAVPLTLASGKSQLGVAIDGVGEMTTTLLLVVVAAKIVAVGIALTTGFIGGPVMPTLFIGGAAGLALHSALPGIPLTLAFSCMLVAVPGISIGAPFTMVFLAGLTVGIGPVESVPAAIAVLTAYTVTAGFGWLGLPTERTQVDISEVTVQSELFEIGEDTT